MDVVPGYDFQVVAFPIEHSQRENRPNTNRRPHKPPNRSIPHEHKSCCVRYALKDENIPGRAEGKVGGRIPHNAPSERPQSPQESMRGSGMGEWAGES